MVARWQNFAAQRSRAIVQKPEGPNTYDSKNPSIAIWQPFRKHGVSKLQQVPGHQYPHNFGIFDSLNISFTATSELLVHKFGAFLDPPLPSPTV